jgi:hypothetical protein
MNLGGRMFYSETCDRTSVRSDKSHAWLFFISFSFGEIGEDWRIYAKPYSCTQHCDLFFWLLSSAFHAKVEWYFEISKLKKNSQIPFVLIFRNIIFIHSVVEVC